MSKKTTKPNSDRLTFEQVGRIQKDAARKVLRGIQEIEQRHQLQKLYAEAGAHLPKTQDGKPIYPGMEMWLVGTSLDGEDAGNRKAEVTSVAKDHVWANLDGDQVPWDASQIYSSKEAAKGEGAK
jgi:hypothetical protein